MSKAVQVCSIEKFIPKAIRGISKFTGKAA
jgi:hypothetical protein